MVSMRILSLASAYQLVSVVLFSTASAWLLPNRALAVLVSGAVMTLNFFGLRWLASKALNSERRRAAYAVALIGKFFVITGVLAAMVLVFRLDVIGIALGMSTLFVGIGLATVHQSFSAAAAD